MEKKMTGADMATRFSPQEIEADLYKAWEEAGAFTAHRVEGKKPFTIVMPPPNITGQLHMGHAMDCILQDAPIRFLCREDCPGFEYRDPEAAPSEPGIQYPFAGLQQLLQKNEEV